MSGMWICDNPKCNKQFEPSAKMKDLKAENGARRFFCASCRKSMVDDKIGKRMGWVRKADTVRK